MRPGSELSQQHWRDGLTAVGDTAIDRTITMEIADTRVDEIVIVAVKGRVDISNVKVLREKVSALIEAGELRIVFDLAELDYIGSTGLHVLIKTAQRLSSANGGVTVASLQPRVKEVFDIAGMPSILRIYATQEDNVVFDRLSDGPYTGLSPRLERAEFAAEILKFLVPSVLLAFGLILWRTALQRRNPKGAGSPRAQE